MKLWADLGVQGHPRKARQPPDLERGPVSFEDSSLESVNLNGGFCRRGVNVFASAIADICVAYGHDRSALPGGARSVKLRLRRFGNRDATHE